LRGRQRGAVLHAGYLQRLDGNQLQRADQRDGVHVVEIAQVRDAEELALHLALAVGDDGGEARFQLLHDHAGIDALPVEERQ
jgi:hypothetical protein